MGRIQHSAARSTPSAILLLVEVRPLYYSTKFSALSELDDFLASFAFFAVEDKTDMTSSLFFEGQAFELILWHVLRDKIMTPLYLVFVL